MINMWILSALNYKKGLVMPISKVVATVLLVCVVLTSSSLRADWLADNQRSDGGVYTSTDLATMEQSSLQTLLTAQLSSDLTAVNTATLRAFLLSKPALDTEHLSAKALAGASVEQGENLAAILLERQNSDGGFASQAGYQSTPYDTYWALHALEVMGQLSDQQRFSAIQFLLSKQRDNGAWRYVTTESSYLTALIQGLLTTYRSQVGNVSQAVAKASAFLSQHFASTQTLTSDDFDLCTAVSSLSAANSTTDLTAMVDKVIASKHSDGHWKNDVFSTAVCLRALLQYEAAQSVDTVAVVAGRLVRSGSDRPIAGAVITSGDFSATSNARGEFQATGVLLGSTTLEFSAPGYESTVRAVSMNSGRNDIGVIALAPLTDVAGVVGRVFDSKSLKPLAGVNIALNGVKSYQISTDTQGYFDVSTLAAGSYTFTTNKTNYYSARSNFSVVAGKQLELAVPLVAEGAVLDDSPASVAGRIVDGSTGQPIAAEVRLQSGGTVLSGVDGRFIFNDVARGRYSIEVVHAEYVTATFHFGFPSGADGTMGDLIVYPRSSVVAADDISLQVNVTNAVTGRAISGAAVTKGAIVQNTDASGVATLTDISTLAFEIVVSAVGYHSQRLSLSASGFGSFNANVDLTPESSTSLDTVSLSGIVTNRAGQPIEAAIVDVDDVGLGITTDGSGAWSVDGLSQLSFVLSVSKAGYYPVTRNISVEKFGQYQLDLELDKVDNTAWQVYYLKSENSDITANTQLQFSTSVQNTSSDEASVIVRGQVFNTDGEWVGELVPYTSERPQTDPRVSFAAGEIKVLTLPFQTRQLPAGQYLATIEIVEEGSITRDLPSGVVYASSNTHFSIEPTITFSGDFDFSPPVSQAGAQTPVLLDVLLFNEGNTPIPDDDYRLLISSDDGTTLLERTVSVGEIPSGNTLRVSFGSWEANAAGHLSVQLNAVSSAELGEVLGVYYVGDLATAQFALDQSVFSEGNHETEARLTINGVDTTQNASTDPLFDRAVEAVRKAGEFVGEEAVAWHRRNRCQGCHIQTQSLVGMASAAPFTDIDAFQMRFLFNTLASSQQSDGRIRISNDQHIQTQQQFAVWSMVEWPEKLQAHRTKLKALEYMWSRRGSYNGYTYFNRDHKTGWTTTCCEASTAIVTRAIVDLILSDRELGSTPIVDYSSLPDRDLSSVASYPAGTHLDGRDLYIAKLGAIERFNLDTGESQIVYQAVDSEILFDVVLGSDSNLYATTATRVLKIKDGVLIDQLALAANQLRDIVEWGGELYLADRNGQKIWRVSHALEAVVFSQGGVLNWPTGLVVDSDNQRLIVANQLGYNLLALNKAGEAEVIVDGFAFKPVQVVKANNGYYVATQRHYLSGAASDAAIQYVNTDGTIVTALNRSAYNYSVYGLQIANDSVVFVDNYTNKLGAMALGELDRSFIATLEDGLPLILKAFISGKDRHDSEIVRVAFRLMGLSELEKVIQDEALLLELEGAKTTIQDMLRVRQNDDGGWGAFRNDPSDPLTTAWVGYALDYTNPSASDPVVRNAITYLLNAQYGNGSWDGSYFDSFLGTTSMVMAYMPRALERLGGLDVSVSLRTADDVSLGSFSIAPSESTPQADGNTLHRWDLMGVTTTGQTINMDVDIMGLLRGESKPVASLATLAFENSFTSDVIFSDIDIPHVMAVSGVILGTDTDKEAYQANEEVLIDSLIQNSGLAINDGRLQVIIRSKQGGFVATVIDQLVDVAAAASATRDTQWNTGRYPAGDYQVLAQLFSDQGDILAEAVAPFTILPSDGQQQVGVDDRYRTAITTDKAIYNQYESVQISSQIVNEVLNQTQAPVLAVLQVTAPTGEQLFRRNIVVPAMAPAAVNDYFDLLTLADAPKGIYQASITLYSADRSQHLAGSEALFTVIEHPFAHLRGKVEVEKPSYSRGQTVVCSESLSNRSTTQSLSAHITYKVIRMDGEPVQVRVDSEQLALNANQHYVTSHSYSSENLEPGSYTCVLSARIDDQEEVLDFAAFTIELPLVELSLTTGEYGRLLILMDRPGGSCFGHGGRHSTSQQEAVKLEHSHAGSTESCYCDHSVTDSKYGKQSGGYRTDLTSSADQDAYLRALLDAHGLSYTVVYNARDFTREFHSGLYHSYALMSEKVWLSLDVEQQLREAVYSGAGLYIAGAFNWRNSYLERALGIYSTGRQQQADGVLIPVGALGADWPATTIRPHAMLDFERCGAIALGVYVNPKRGTTPRDPNCYNLDGVDAAIVAYYYGKGKAVYVGFDTIDEATFAGENNSYAEVLLYGLQYIQPSDFPIRRGSVVPLSIGVSVQDLSVAAKLRLTLPDNMSSVEHKPSMTSVGDEQNVWELPVNLSESDTLHVQSYVLWTDDNDAEINAHLSTMIDGETVVLGDAQLHLVAEAYRNYLADGLVVLEALVANYPDNRSFKKALRYAKYAERAVAKGFSWTGTHFILASVNRLADDARRRKRTQSPEIPEANEARYLLDIAMFRLLAGVKE